MTRIFWNQGNEFYAPMIRRHATLWKAVEGIIVERKPQSMLEIGCGSAHLAPLIPKYHGVDLNNEMLVHAHEVHPHATFTIGNWTMLDTSSLVGQYEVVLACGVIEHCQHWRPFIDNIIVVQPQLALVSFSMSNGITQEVIRQVTKPGCEPYYTNRYVLDDISAEFGDCATWQKFPYATGIDCLLTLDCRQEKP